MSGSGFDQFANEFVSAMMNLTGEETEMPDESGAWVRKTARDKKHGMTVDEMRAFMKTVDERDISGDARILIWANWNQSFYKVEVRGQDTVK